MPDTYTPVLNLVQPEVGASRDTWGTKWNQNATILDQFVSQFCQIGIIADFAGPNAPSGWLVCDGRTVSRTTYSALFAVIGTYWGAGDGSTTFGLPNVNGRALIGPGSITDQGGLGYTFGFTQMAGFIYSPIAQLNLPNYVMSTDTQGYHYHAGSTAAAGPWNSVSDAQGFHSHGDWTLANNADHTHAGYTDNPGDHAHGYNMASFGSGAFVQGGGGTQIAINGSLTGNAGNHTHAVQTYGASNSHQHQINGDGSHQHNVSIPSHTHGIYGDGNHAHSVSLGGGGVPLTVISPFIVVTKIIYAGSQASTSVMTASAPAPTTDRDDELALIREELAALRALFAPPATRRVTHAPPRGPH